MSGSVWAARGRRAGSGARVSACASSLEWERSGFWSSACATCLGHVARVSWTWPERGSGGAPAARPSARPAPPRSRRRGARAGEGWRRAGPQPRAAQPRTCASASRTSPRAPRGRTTRPPRRSTRQQRRRREDSAHPLGELAPPAAVCEGEGRPGGEGGRLRRPKLARRPPDEDSATVAARSDAARRDAERQRQPLRVWPLQRGSGPE